MKIRRRYKNNSKVNILLPLVFLFIVFLSVGYSSLNQELNITSEAVFRVEEDIRITDIKLVGNTFNGIENYNSSYSKDRIKTGITLNEANSSITYQVTITNTGNVPMNLSFLDNINYNNDGITYELNEKLPFMINKGEEKRVEITYKWNSYNEKSKNLDSLIKFNFIKAESVLAKGSSSSFVNNSSFDRSKVESIKFMPTIDVPSSAIEVWDGSLNKDGSVMVYTLDNDSNDLYELYIAGYGELKLSEASYLFQNFTSMVTLDFDNLVTTENVTNMFAMFYQCGKLLNLDVSNFNMRNVTTVMSIFRDCSSLKSLKLNNWNAEKLTNIDYMFYGCSSVTELEMNNFKASILTYLEGMFGNSYYNPKYSTLKIGAVQKIDMNNWSIPKVTNLSYMFAGLNNLTELNMEGFNAPSAINLEGSFRECAKLTDIDLSNLDTTNVTNMGGLFRYCSKLTNIKISNFNTSNVITMASMFQGCSNLMSVDLSNFVTSNVTNMESMFNGCSQLAGTLDLSHFNVQNVTTMRYMLYNCSKVTNLKLNNWSAEKLTNIDNMFYGCSSLITLDISGIDSETYEKDIFKSMINQVGNITFYVKDSDCKDLLEAIKPNATVIIKV